MTDPRLYCSDRLLAKTAITLGSADSHYLVSVMRKRAGDRVRLFNAPDGEWSAELTTAHRKAAQLTIHQQIREPAAGPDIHLLFAPVKKNRTDFIVEKATELGVRRLVPVITQRTIAQTVRTDRMKGLAKEAAEQTERLDLPEIGDAVKLPSVLDDWPNDRVLYFCDEAGDAPPMLAALREQAYEAAAILIGPEGGFTPEERELIRSAKNALPVSLGPRILRADTAVVAALSLYQSVCGDWDNGAQGRD